MVATLILAQILAADPAAVKTRIRGSVEASLRRKVGQHSSALAAQVARLLRWRGNLIRDIHPDDRIAVDYELDAEGEPLLGALDYRGSAITLKAYRFTGPDQIARFYDAKGQLIEPLMKHHPVPTYVQITENVQDQRGLRKHHGIDFKAAMGAPVILPFAGTVKRVNWSTRFNGNCVEVLYTKPRMLARFLHLDTVVAGVKAGAKLPAGFRVGTVGNTGRSSAPHLHYELRSLRGAVLRPLKVHATEVRQLPPGSMPLFRARMVEARHRLEGKPSLQGALLPAAERSSRP